MSELEVIDEVVDKAADDETSFYPAAPNLIWDFAYGISHSFAPAEEDCSLLRKTIRSSGKMQTLKIKSYEPSTFTRIRGVSGVTDDEFRAEWEPQTVANNVASKGAGKSGALFVVSKTGKFLLKTLRKDEKDKLRELSHGLLSHFQAYPGSLVSRQYILCRIEAQGSRKYFVVFNNLFSSPETMPTLRYDLKGAVVNRKSQPSALSNPNHVRMDLDDPRTFPIESGIRQELLQQLNLDADLLEKHNIMDYSLLVGLVLKENQAAEMVVEKEEGDKKKKKSKKKRDKKKRETENKAVTLDSIWRTGLPSASDPNEHYMVGIIDILQDYNTFKKSAHLLKVIIWRHSDGLSTVAADFYAKRFKAYMANNVLVEGTSLQESVVVAEPQLE